MSETNNVFISWSGPRSKGAAEALKEWLPMILQAARPWMSANDIDKGTRWREEVSAALDVTKAGIACLTPENLTAEWLLFEAGALSKIRDAKTRVWTYLLAGLQPQDIKEPLAMFQATIAEKEDTRKLLHSINKNLDTTVDEGRLNHLFDKLWPDLEQKLRALPPPSGVTPPKRSTDEIAADGLEILRALAPLVQGIAAEIEMIRGKRLSEEQLQRWLAQNPSGNVFVSSATPVRASGFETLRKMLTLSTPPDSLPATKEPEGATNQPSSPPRSRRRRAPR